jgi:hypothetical protein
MNYKDTVQNFKANLSDAHLINYDKREQVNIVFTTIYIYAKAMLIGIYKWILGKSTPKSTYENEKCYYKAWFCYIVAKEIMKR